MTNNQGGAGPHTEHIGPNSLKHHRRKPSTEGVFLNPYFRSEGDPFFSFLAFFLKGLRLDTSGSKKNEICVLGFVLVGRSPDKLSVVGTWTNG